MSAPDERLLVENLLRSLHHPYVVELGACDGDDTVWLLDTVREVWRGQTPDHEIPRYVLVEPDPRNLRILRGRGFDGASPGVNLIRGAVSKQSGTARFHMCDNATGQALGSGSLREPTLHKTAIPWCTFPSETEVTTYTLDELFLNHQLPRIDLLWCDIQGAERDMIEGGGLSLQRTRYLFVEVENQALYDGQATKPELLAMLPGWKVLREVEYNALLANELWHERPVTPEEASAIPHA
jgi:2-O-methyltransferase